MPEELLCYLLPLHSPPVREWKALFVSRRVALKSTIPGDMFNIPLRTSDIFFCMKSDICPVNILQLPLCTRKHFILWPRKWCLRGVSLQGLQQHPGSRGLGKSHSDPYRREGGGLQRERRGNRGRERRCSELVRYIYIAKCLHSQMCSVVWTCSKTAKTHFSSSGDSLLVGVFDGWW